MSTTSATHDLARLRFGPVLALAARVWRRAADRRLQPYGLTEATWLPLVRLARSSTPMRQKDLAASLGLDGSSVVRILDALESSGLVERRAEAGDRRAKAIFITEQGQVVVAQVERVSQAVRDEALQGMSDDEVLQAYSLLTRICERLDVVEEGGAA
jgi:MarR family transcriptional regulator, transcriptional regulator for hemolysin